jgi:hypothetical protein
MSRKVDAMNKRLKGLLVAALAAIALPAAAHHSFAIYDMTQNIEFDGVVETLKMRNPHMAMTLTVANPDGTKKTINFVEGAPANMIVRLGLNPADVAPGKPIKAIGAPRKDDPNAYFLKAIILPDGHRYNAVGP